MYSVSSTVILNPKPLDRIRLFSCVGPCWTLPGDGTVLKGWLNKLHAETHNLKLQWKPHDFVHLLARVSSSMFLLFQAQTSPEKLLSADLPCQPKRRARRARRAQRRAGGGTGDVG